MKYNTVKHILFVLVLMLIIGCIKRGNTELEQITEYYKGFKNSNYNQIKSTISDSLVIVEGDYIMSFTKESFYEQFKWDSIFKPVYSLTKIENKGEQIVATVSVKSLRFEFLKNNPLTCSHKFYFKSGKITKIENLNCIDANWEVWQSERDSLVSWVKVNHPELDGFIHDLSMKGAIDYLSAIELYKQDK